MRAGAAVLAVCVIGACGGSASSSGDPDAGAASSSGGSSSGGSSGTSSSGGGSSSGSSSGDPDDGGPADASREANAPGCPAAFADPAPDGHCTVGLTCAYDEGSCACLGYCGGVAPPDDVDFSHWACTPKRTDGCPDVKPMPSTSCNAPGKACDYGDCCIEQLTCSGGTWKSNGLTCPP